MVEREFKTKVVTGKVRMSFVNVFYPRVIGERNELKYSLCMMIKKEDSKTIDDIKSAIKEAVLKGKKIWGDRIPEGLALPLKDGDTREEEKLEFKNHFYLNASSKEKPGIVDRNLNTINDSKEFYSGCYGRVSLVFYPYKYGEKVGVASALNNIQKLKDGEYLGAKSKAEDDFRENKFIDNDDYFENDIFNEENYDLL